MCVYAVIVTIITTSWTHTHSHCSSGVQRFLNLFISDIIFLRSSPTALGSWEGKILNMSVNDVSISSSLNSFWVTLSCLGQRHLPFPLLLTKNGVNLNGR